MEYNMKLHEDKKLFSDILIATSQHLDIKLEFVEKDYWITSALKHLSNSKYFNNAVFKGGTSLSKGYNLIDRFSEDIDIAIINDSNKTPNEIKTIIRSIEKAITPDLSELKIDGVTSKGSKFRKSVFEYESTIKENQANRLIVEVNSFANPFPFNQLIIKSMIHDFFKKAGNDTFIIQNGLNPFAVNVLSKEQTLLEKLVSLIRVSYNKNVIESISEKIRHFYDLYFLMLQSDCISFAASENFKQQFDILLQHDKELFDEPKGWQVKEIDESPLIINFELIWGKIKYKYQSELSALSYRDIPNEKLISEVFIKLINRIK
jgi:predicted nucleotidyltransferase component of viral defense system